MPYLTVYTNKEIKNGAEIAEKAAMLTAQILHKPVTYVVANVIYNPQMSFGGKSDNMGALVELKSIGLGDKDKFVADMTEFLAENIGIENKEFIAMALIDAPAAYTACAGRTFG